MNLYTTFVLNASRSPETAEGDPGRRFVEDRMAVDYYIADKHIKAEYEAFRKFWEDELFPEFIKNCTATARKPAAESSTRICRGDRRGSSVRLFLRPFNVRLPYKTLWLPVNHAGVFWRSV